MLGWVVSQSVTMRPFFYFYGKYCRFFSLLKAFTLLLNCQNDLVIQISHGNPCKILMILDLVASLSLSRNRYLLFYTKHTIGTLAKSCDLSNMNYVQTSYIVSVIWRFSSPHLLILVSTAMALSYAKLN